MALSCQRLGDNPRDHDGTFRGFYPPSSADVNSLKPEVNQDLAEVFPPPDKILPEEKNEITDFPTWKIYPPPPPPHWHWKPAEDGVRPEGPGEGVGLQYQNSIQGRDDPSGPGPSTGGRDSHAFQIQDCEIPRSESIKCDFGLNEEGVFEVWYEESAPSNGITEPLTSLANGASVDGITKGKGKTRIARVPSLKEYFTDLDYLLGVCCDGPAKSFAFRRLRYLASKWSMYCLLNEYQELADMKVGAAAFRHSGLAIDEQI